MQKVSICSWTRHGQSTLWAAICRRNVVISMPGLNATTGIVVFDTESGEILTPDQAAQAARDIERDLPD